MFVRIFEAVDALMFYILVPAACLVSLYLGGSWLIEPPPPDQYGFVSILDTPGMRKMMLFCGVLLLLGWCLMYILRKRRQAMLRELNELNKNNEDSRNDK